MDWKKERHFLHFTRCVSEEIDCCLKLFTSVCCAYKSHLVWHAKREQKCVIEFRRQPSAHRSALFAFKPPHRQREQRQQWLGILISTFTKEFCNRHSFISGIGLEFQMRSSTHWCFASNDSRFGSNQKNFGRRERVMPSHVLACRIKLWLKRKWIRESSPIVMNENVFSTDSVIYDYSIATWN